MSYRVLIVEDHPDISSVVKKYFENDGFEVVLADNGFEGLVAFRKETFHLIILDWMMPGIDGMTVLHEIRQESEIPIIMLTAKLEEQDRLKGFDYGADDYVVKPFSVKELLSRAKRLIKRVYGELDSEHYHIGDLIIQPATMKAFRGPLEIDLTAAEFKVLVTFVKHRGQLLTREQLIEWSFGNTFEGYERSMDTYVKRLRQKIEPDPAHPTYIITKYGAGYIFGGE